jgi:hypothetical protein
MAMPVLTQATQILCAHGVPGVPMPSQVRVLSRGQPLLTQADIATVAGCPFTLPGPTPSPCVQVRWTTASLRVRASGVPVVLQGSATLCLAATQAPQGPATIPAASPSVTAL